jgi:type II secretory pathway pseudopilin PulG
MKKYCIGFSLLELSIVLLIMTMLLALSLSSGKYFMEQNHIRATYIKLNTIQNSLKAFLVQNKRLPCPAGLALSTGQELSSCTSSSATNGIFVTSGVVRGWVPYKTLNLTSDIAYDSWNSKISYTVSTSSVSDFMQMSTSFNGLTMYDASTTTSVASDIVYALISYGQNRLGAYNKDSTVNSTKNISSAESMNIPSSSNSSNNFIYSSTANSYDDLVKYESRMQMVIDCGIDDISCYITSSIVSTLLTNAGITSTPTFTLPSSNFLKYGNTIISSDDNYKIKCFKYGRLGVSQND